MKLNKNVIDKIYRNNKFEIPKIELKANKADIMIPYELKLGFVDTTSEGVVFSSELNDYSQFERIFTGYESLLAVWENSTNTTVSTLGNEKLLHKNFTTGRVIPVWVDTETASTDFTNIENMGGDKFTAERINDVLEVYVNGFIDKKDVVKFYQIPNKFGDSLYYIDTVNEYNNPNNNEIKYSKITLRSVNNRLAETGLSVKQYIQFAAPGEGYAKPNVVKLLTYRDLQKYDFKYDDFDAVPAELLNGTTILAKKYGGSNLYTKLVKKNDMWVVIGNESGVLLDELALRNKPITSFQVEIFGKGVLSDIYFYGRPIKKLSNSQNEIIERPRLLLLNEGLQPDKSQKDATEAYARNTEYKLIRRSRLVVESWYKSVKEQINTQMNPMAQKEYSGVLEMFYGKATDQVNINPVARVFGDIFTLGIAEAFWPTTVEFSQANGEIIKNINNSDFSSIFLNNFIKNKSVPRLPLSYKESVAWNLSMIPFIGGFLNNLTSGLVPGWRDTRDLGGRNYNISGIIPSDLMDFYQNALMSPQRVGDDAYTSIPLNDLQSDSSPETTSRVDYATTLHYTLTDLFHTLDIHGQEFEKGNTKDFGYVSTNGNKIIAWDVNQSHAIKNNEVAGYAVDLWGLHFLGDADVKMTFFSGSTPVYSTKVKTLSNLTGSVRDWNSNYKLSNWSAPAGTIVDNGTYYRFLPSDFTINDLGATGNTQLQNGFGQGLLNAEYQLDSQGRILLDANGQPIVKYDNKGVAGGAFVGDKLGGTFTGANSYPKTEINKIEQDKLIINPDKIYEMNSRIDSGYGDYTKVYEKNIKDILNDYKYSYDYIGSFSFLRLSFEINITGDGGASIAGNILSFGLSTRDSSSSNSASDLTWEVIRNLSNYDLQWDTGNKDIVLDCYDSGSGAEIRLKVLSNGNLVVELKRADTDTTRIHNANVRITSASVFN